MHAYMHTKLLQLCPTLCDPMDCSPPGSSVHVIIQVRYWSGLPCPPAEDLLHPVIQHESLMSPALAGGFLTTDGRKPPGEPHTVPYL